MNDEVELIDFSWSDAWILMSLSGGSSLTEIITGADMINRAIPTHKEIETALVKLINANVLKVSDGQYTLSKEVQRDLDELKDKPGGLFTLVDKSEKYLRKKKFKRVLATGFKLDEAALDSAYKEYKKLGK